MSSEETPVKTERDIVRKWCKELDLSSKQEKDWRKDSERVVKIYRGEDCRTDSDNGGTELKRNAFNILWTNTETMRPALYNSTPQPVCRRRFRDESPVGKAAAEVLERALSFSIDAYDFDERISLAIDDYLLRVAALPVSAISPLLKKPKAQPRKKSAKRLPTRK